MRRPAPLAADALHWCTLAVAHPSEPAGSAYCQSKGAVLQDTYAHQTRAGSKKESKGHIKDLIGWLDVMGELWVTSGDECT